MHRQIWENVPVSCVWSGVSWELAHTENGRNRKLKSIFINFNAESNRRRIDFYQSNEFCDSWMNIKLR